MGTITLNWNDTNDNEEGFRVYRSIGTPLDRNNLPSPIANLSPNVNEYVDVADFNDQEVHYMVSTYRTVSGNLYERISKEFRIQSGIPFAPGPKAFIGGDIDEGFFGEVSAGELFTGDELASLVGLTAGVSQNSNEPWLKFAIDGEIVYIAKKPLRHSISWDDLYAAGCVYGTDDNGLHPTGTPTNQNKIVTKDGFQFKVRLMTGAHADPMTRDNTVAGSLSGMGSEWNRLIYRVHQSIPTGVETNDGGPQIGSNWASYTDSDLVVGSGNGRASWTQEAVASIPTNRVVRGVSRVSVLTRYTSSESNTDCGWRPLLQLVR